MLMKILKYVLILLVLGIVSLSVFVATKDGKYTIEYEKKSELSSNSIYKYVIDLRNYNDWNSFELKDVKTDTIHSGLKARAFTNHSSIQINALEVNKKINFVIDHKGTITNNEITLTSQKDQTTLIRWISEGELGFLDKFKSLFLGGASSLVGAPYEKMLNNINFILTEEIEKFSLKAEGITYVPETYFIQQLIVTKIEDLGDKVFESMQTLNNFVKMNDFIKVKGDPFTFFGQMNVATGKVEYYVCLPIDKEIMTSEGSDIFFAKIPAHYAYKSILTGDYAHSDKAWKKNDEEIAAKKLNHNYSVKPRAVFKNSILHTHKHSQWITEMLTPVNESVVPIQETVEEQTSSNSAQLVQPDTIQ